MRAASLNLGLPDGPDSSEFSNNRWITDFYTVHRSILILNTLHTVWGGTRSRVPGPLNPLLYITSKIDFSAV